MRANGHKLAVASLKANPGHAGIVDEACQVLSLLALLVHKRSDIVDEACQVLSLLASLVYTYEVTTSSSTYRSTANTPTFVLVKQVN